MKLLYFDSVGGASGDMILGALIDLGVDAKRIEQALRGLAVEPFEIEARPFSTHHLRGIQCHVRHRPGHAHPHDHEHPEHGHRNLADIAKLISDSELPPPVRARSLRVFERLADAEAHVHQTGRDNIHFHEVGAVDSIVDIVGSCLALDELAVEGMAVGPLPMGQGTITCAHGVYPNPAPATVELLKGFPLTQTAEPFELVTPTAAALLAEWKSMDLPPAGARLVRAGYSFGHRVLHGRPNLLRASLLEAAPSAGVGEDCRVLECNVDDTTPELLGNLTERLRQAGALDVFTTPVQMKKQRPGVLLTVLAAPEQREQMLELIFLECTTLGVREYTVHRTVLERRHETVQTPFGSIRIKIGRWNGRDVTFAPELDDCQRRAAEHDAPVRRVYEAAAHAAGALRA
jgi:uncharacterized protein (TIGR00299 family) protein